MYSLEVLTGTALTHLRHIVIQVETAMAGLRTEARLLSDLRRWIHSHGERAKSVEDAITNLQESRFITPLFPRNMPPVVGEIAEGEEPAQHEPGLAKGQQENHYFARGIDPLLERLDHRIKQIHDEALRICDYYRTYAKQGQAEAVRFADPDDRKKIFYKVQPSVRWADKNNPASTLRITWQNEIYDEARVRHWIDIPIGRGKYKSDKAKEENKASDEPDTMYNLDLLAKLAHNKFPQTWLLRTLSETETALAGLRTEARFVDDLRKRVKEHAALALALEGYINDLQDKGGIKKLFPRNFPAHVPKPL